MGYGNDIINSVRKIGLNGGRFMLSICGADCCTECGRKDECGGCVKTGGHPFGGKCFAAECIKRGGFEEFKSIKKALTEEFNALGIKDLEVKDLNLLNGFYVNLEYPLPNGQSVKFLEDNNVYWGNQIEIPGSDRCYGIVADDNYLLVCEYGCGGTEPEIILYRKRARLNR
jgi:hypothetical protein